MPQSTPVIVVVAIFSFLSSWRDAWGPLIYLTSQDNRTIPLGLLLFSGAFDRPAEPQMMAATVVALVVPVVLYALGQRYIDSGVAIAEVK